MKRSLINLYLLVLQRIFSSFPNSLIGNPGFSMTSGFRVNPPYVWRIKPGMTAKSHCLTVFIEKFAVVLGVVFLIIFKSGASYSLTLDEAISLPKGHLQSYSASL